MQSLVGTHKPDCKKCPSYCCYALSRPASGGFSDPSNSPAPCKHLDVCEACSCKIHNVLSSRSGTCGLYSCFGAGNITQEVFGEHTQAYASLLSQKAFREIEAMCKYVGLFREFVESIGKECGDILEHLQEKVVEIAKSMPQEGNWKDLIKSFYTLLTEYMKSRAIGIQTFPRTGEKAFVFLTK